MLYGSSSVLSGAEDYCEDLRRQILVFDFQVLVLCFKKCFSVLKKQAC